MDIVLLVVGLLLILVGIIGCIVPGLPGPLSGWAGLLVTIFAKVIPDDWNLILLTLTAAVVVSVLDYFIPAIGTKKFGGSKYGTYGAMIGLLVGIFAPIPGGIIIGPFVGAFIGEYIKNSDAPQATKAAFGAFTGFLVSTGMQLIVSIAFLFVFIRLLRENWDSITSLFS